MSIILQLTAFILVALAHIGIAYLLVRLLGNSEVTSETNGFRSDSGPNIQDRNE